MSGFDFLQSFSQLVGMFFFFFPCEAQNGLAEKNKNNNNSQPVLSSENISQTFNSVLAQRESYWTHPIH